MNFKKTWKRANDGFTLVELIVVIAILAILAGIAVPAYSGYIKKANEAADHQVLAAVNTAFAAAVLENGEDFNNVTYAQLATSSNGEGVTINGVNNSVTGVKSADYNAAFQTYLSCPVETKVIAAFDYVRGVGFVDKNSDIAKKTVAYGGTNYQVNVGSIEAIKGSVYIENVDGLQEQLNGLSNAFGKIVSSDDMDFSGLFGAEFDAYLKTLPEDQRGNATVLYVAEKAGNYDAKKVGEMLSNVRQKLPNENASVVDLFNAAASTGSTDPLVDVAVMYGAVVGFANSEAGKNAGFTMGDATDGQGLVNAFTSLAQNKDTQTAFATYVGTVAGGEFTPSDTFTQDVNGFLGAMDAINSVSGGLDKGNANLWNDAAMDELLAELLK